MLLILAIGWMPFARAYASVRSGDDQHGCRAVIEGVRVACCDGSPLLEDGLEFGELLQRSVAALALIYLDVDCGFAGPYRDRHHLIDEALCVLGVAWNFLGTPATNVWELSDRPVALRLLGNAARLDDGPPVAFAGRR